MKVISPLPARTLKLFAPEELPSSRPLNKIFLLSVEISTVEIDITTGSENVNVPLPDPVRLAPKLTFAPLVSKVIADVNV